MLKTVIEIIIFTINIVIQKMIMDLIKEIPNNFIVSYAIDMGWGNKFPIQLFDLFYLLKKLKQLTNSQNAKIIVVFL